MYPNKYFSLGQWSGDPDDSPLGRNRYQYGNAVRSMAMIRTPAAAAYSAGAPFDFFEIQDPSSGTWRFTLRPDVAPSSPIILNRTVQINIQGQTAIQVANSIATGISEVSAAQNMGLPGARLQAAAQIHPSPVDNQLTITSLLIAGKLLLDTTGITGVAGFVFTQFPPGRNNYGLVAGSTSAGGLIFCVAGASLVDTETVTIVAPDLSNPASSITQLFEFDSGAGVTAGRTAIPFTGGDTAATVAASFAAAINNPAVPPTGRGPNFGMKAILRTGDTVIYLVSRKGSIGGSIFSAALMAETVANANFIVVGPTGGQDGSILIPLRWGLSRGMIPQSAGGFDEEGGEG